MDDKKVSFIEVLWHHDVLSSIYQLSQYFSEWEPIIITTETLSKKSRLNNNRIKVIRLKNLYRYYWASSLNLYRRLIYLPKLFIEMKKEGEELVKIVEKEKPNIIIINTLAAPFYFYPLFKWVKKSKPKTSIVIVLHESHFWDFKLFIKNASIKELREGKFGCLIFNILNKKYIKGIIKLGEYVELPPTLKSIKTLTIPSRLSLNNHSFVKKTTDKIYFVIPGKVQQSKGKNYISILKAFKNILKDGYKNKIELILLGKMADKKVENMIKDESLQGIIKYYHDFVDEEEFNLWLSKSHFAIIPVAPNTPYGKYKISGLLNDALTNALPILLPDTYAPHYKFDENVIRFSWENIEEAIKKAIEIVLKRPEEYNKVQEKAIEIANSFHPSKIAPKFEEFLDEIVEGKEQ